LNSKKLLSGFGFHVAFGGFAGADQITIAMRIVDPRYTGPEFAGFNIFQWEGRLLPRISMVLLIGCYCTGH
jgi:hypothetical protein